MTTTRCLPAALALLTACPHPGDLRIATTAVPAGNVDSAYSAAVETTGGTAPLHFELSQGFLQAGVELDADTGVLGGTPTEPGVLTFTVRASDAGGASVEQPLTLRIFPNPPPRITTTELRSAVVGRPYSLGLQALDGKAPYAWSLGGGALPAGLQLQTTGVLDGTATAATAASGVELAATDANGQQARSTLSIAAYLEVVLAPAALPDGYTDAAYSVTFSSAGGLPPYRYSLVGGSLPGGLSLDVAAGRLSGTPAMAGTWTCSVQVRDESGQAPSTRYTLGVYAPPRIETTALPDGLKNVPYATSLASSGGRAPLSFTLAAGGLPDGLSLSTDGTLSGTPSTIATYQFDVRVADANGRTDLRSFTVAIGGP